MTRSELLLFVDDDEAGRELGLYNLTAAGYEVDLAADGRQAMELFSARRYDLVVTDLRMPRVSGMEVLRQVKDRRPDVPVVVITAHGKVETAVEAMRAGAYDFIEKPFGREVLLLVIARALERRRLAEENRELRRKVAGIERVIVCRSPAMTRLLDNADRVARSDAAVLITGESGTGKELVARRIHARSDRVDGPFVPVNCAAIPGELLESELFGHERGAYTGADRARQGRFRKAGGGTIFLDEVAEIPLALQGKLLRVLQEKMVDVVGADQPTAVDVRVVAATNSSLPEMLEARTFREDLYYRLNVVELQAPPLRERIEDVEVLMRHFLSRLAPGRDLVVPAAVMAGLTRHRWPGNVRELENACERLVILCDGDTLRAEDLPPAVRTARAGSSVAPVGEFISLPEEGLSLVDLERRVIELALERKKWNVTQAAAYLQIPRHVLAYRIEKYGIRRG